MAKVGIYMPAYNVEKYVFEAIKSIKNQTFKDWKLVIMDDCSSDNTYNVVKTILDTTIERDERIILLKQDVHCGKVGKIGNQCISHLNDCEYICHVDSDDYIPKYCFKTFVDFLELNKEIGACCGNFMCFNDEGKVWSYPHVSNSGEFNPDIMLQYMCFFPMRFYRKTVIDAVGGLSNDLDFSEDYDLALKVSEITEIKRIKNPITYYYRQHPNQVSIKNIKEQNLCAKKALEDSLKRRGIYAKVINDAPPFKIQKLKLFGVV